MSKQPNDGGPAFPHMKAEGHNDYVAGLSLRDYFAGHALAGLLAQSPVARSAREFASEAFMVADAMLAARTPAHGEEG